MNKRNTILVLLLTFGLTIIISAKKGEVKHNNTKDELEQKMENKTDSQVREFNPAYAHTVYFWLKNPESQGDKEAFVKSLGKFLKNSKYAKTSFIGIPPKASRDVVDGSFTYSLIVSFESANAQALYQKEDAHSVFIEESQSLWSKVIVYDSVGINAHQ